MEHSFNGIMITKADSGYSIVYVNDTFTELTGYNAQEIIGKKPAVLQGPKTNRTVSEQLDRALSEGRLFGGEAINLSKHVSEFAIEWKMVLIKNQKTEASHYLALQRAVARLRNHQTRVDMCHLQMTQISVNVLES